LNKNWKF